MRERLHEIREEHGDDLPLFLEPMGLSLGDLERCACVYAGCGRSGRMRRLGRDATAADEPIRPRGWGTGSRREEGSGLETKPAPGQIEGCLAREDLIGGRRMFESLRELHRFPEQRLARPRAQDRPGVDADPERQADVVPLLERLVLFPQRLEHRKAGVECGAGCGAG